MNVDQAALFKRAGIGAAVFALFLYGGGMFYVYSNPQLVAAVGDATSSPSTLYVSPSGSDTNSGTFYQPFKTLDHARDVVRTLTAGMTSDITVYLRGGRYELDHTFTLTSQDSGKNGFTVFYRNYPGENPVISGGKKVTGWALWQNGIWRTSVGSGVDSRQLYVNGVLATRARTAGAPTGFAKTGTGFTTTLSPTGWTNVQNIEMVSRTVWKTYRCQLQSASSGTIVVQQPCWGLTQSSLIPPLVVLDSVSWLENALQFLDAPGEWYLDKSSGYLYYKPLAGESLASSTVIMPRIEGLVSGMGTADLPIHNITFQGITFTESTWLGPNSSIGFAERQANTYYYQAGSVEVKMIPAAVSFDYAQSLQFIANTFVRAGEAGLALDHAKNNSVAWNTFANLSGSGIIVGDGTDDTIIDSRLITNGNKIYDNTIRAIAREYEGGVGIWLGLTQDSLVRNNEISSVPYSGISIGWGGPGIADPTVAKNNTIKQNYIHDYMQILNDGGGLYSLLSQPGNVYTGNYITNGSNSNGGIYLDNASRYIEVSNNVLLNNKRTAIIKGGDHTIHDNYWQNRYSNDIWWFSGPPTCTPTACGQSTIFNNREIVDATQAPQNIIAAAGIEATGAPIDPPPPIVATTTPPTGTTTPPSGSPPPVSWDFGGAYGNGKSGTTYITYKNPATGAMSCPTGYTATKVYGTTGVDLPVFFCYRAHVDGRDSLFDFGGMYGTGSGTVNKINYNNPATGAQTCPSGYAVASLTGAANLDWSSHFCYRSHSTTQETLLDFGGMYGSGKDITYKNPITGGASCPAGYATTKILGTTGMDWPLYFCYKTHTL